MHHYRHPYHIGAYGLYLGSRYGLYGDNYYYYDTPVYPSVSSYTVTAGQTVPSSQAPSGTVATSGQGQPYQQQAEEAFRAGRYEQALRLSNHALVEQPNDGKLHEFASQALFAVGEFRGAAAAAHRAMSLEKSEDWGYMVKNYARYYRGDAYVKQMDVLDKYIEKNPTAAYAWMLRGYHYGFLGHQDKAQQNLATAVELEARDVRARELLLRFGGKVPEVATQPGKPGSAKATAPAGANLKTAAADKSIDL